MRKKPKPRKSTTHSRRKKKTPTRKAKPAGKKPAARRTGIAAQRKLGLGAVPGAMEAAALTYAQKHLIVRHCIAVCAGTTDFDSNQPLYSIADGIEGCVEACVIDAVHKTVIVRSSDSEDSIVGSI
jgi:hypothetical protein